MARYRNLAGPAAITIARTDSACAGTPRAGPIALRTRWSLTWLPLGQPSCLLLAMASIQGDSKSFIAAGVDRTTYQSGLAAPRLHLRSWRLFSRPSVEPQGLDYEVYSLAEQLGVVLPGGERWGAALVLRVLGHLEGAPFSGDPGISLARSPRAIISFSPTARQCKQTVASRPPDPRPAGCGKAQPALRRWRVAQLVWRRRPGFRTLWRQADARSCDLRPSSLDC